MALTSKLEAIGDAIRSKTGKAEKLSLDAMVSEIEGITTGGDIPQEKFHITGNCDYMFASPAWTWYLEEYGDRITTSGITNAQYMFKDSAVESIPFELDFSTYQSYVRGMFQDSDVKEIAKISNLDAYTMESMFENCGLLRYLPEFENFNPHFNNTTINSLACKRIFTNCYSLRSVPEEFMEQLYTYGDIPEHASVFASLNGLYSMDEVRGLNPTSNKNYLNTNVFYGFGDCCFRWKEVIFKTNDDGTPIDVDWSGQTINLSSIGYAPVSEIMYTNESNTINNGITADKEVTDASSYQRLKNDADWFTCKPEYSRYNHDSAVRTLQSLPDASMRGVVENTDINTIVFNSNMGSQTDGRGVGTLTESEIAEAVAKGFTVSFT